MLLCPLVYPSEQIGVFVRIEYCPSNVHPAANLRTLRREHCHLRVDSKTLRLLSRTKADLLDGNIDLRNRTKSLFDLRSKGMSRNYHRIACRNRNRRIGYRRNQKTERPEAGSMGAAACGYME